jgi:hypothetical protein
VVPVVNQVMVDVGNLLPHPALGKLSKGPLVIMKAGEYEKLDVR